MFNVIGRQTIAGVFIAMLAGTLAVGVPLAHGEETSRASAADLQNRVQALEETLRQIQAEKAAAPVAPALPDPASSSIVPVVLTTADQSPPGATAQSPDQTPAMTAFPSAGWKDGFFLENPDKSFLLRITGQLQTDYRDFLNNHDQTDIDTFLVRRARLGIEATILKYYEFRLLPDFGGTTPSITDAYLNVHYIDAIQFEIGKFKQPISYEQLIQDRYVPFMERSLIDQTVPARDVGAMIHGHNLFEGRLEYAVSVSNGEINGNTDTNDDKDLDGRIAFRPFYEPDGGLLRRLEFGVSGGAGVENEPISPSSLKTPATVPWFAYKSGVLADGLRTRLSPELSYFYGGLGFAAQYYREEQKIQPSAAVPPTNVPTEGYYFMATYLLTGEERTEYAQQIEPLCPFDPHCPVCSPGAWEVVARVSRLDVGSKVFTAGATNLADPTLYSPGATETTFGCNWYLNKWVRSQLNWEHARFDTPVALGPSSAPKTVYLQSQDTLYARLQFIF
jgi:phosphate-selective porin OprO/OprP